MQGVSGLIVETTGIPGSGKTTVAELLRSDLERRGAPSWTGTEVRALYVERVVSPRILVRSIRRDPRHMSARRKKFRSEDKPRLMQKFQRRFSRGWRIFESRIQAIHGRDPELADMMRSWVEKHALTHMMLRTWRMRFRVFLSDEGIVQRAVNLFASETGEFDRDELRRFLRGWAYPDLLIRAQADLDRSLARVRARGLTKRLQGKSESEIQRFMGVSETVVDEICNEARRRCVPVLVVDNNGEREQLGAPPSGYEQCLKTVLKKGRVARSSRWLALPILWMLVFRRLQHFARGCRERRAP